MGAFFLLGGLGKNEPRQPSQHAKARGEGTMGIKSRVPVMLLSLPPVHQPTLAHQTSAKQQT
jgi:hypothetical protein